MLLFIGHTIPGPRLEIFTLFVKLHTSSKLQETR